MGMLTEAILRLLDVALKAASGVIYDIVIFPLAAATHSAIKHIPIIGPTLVANIDAWLERLSADWPDKLP